MPVTFALKAPKPQENAATSTQRASTPIPRIPIPTHLAPKVFPENSKPMDIDIKTDLKNSSTMEKISEFARAAISLKSSPEVDMEEVGDRMDLDDEVGDKMDLDDEVGDRMDLG